MTRPLRGTRPIDAFSTSTPGRYEDGLVEVVRASRGDAAEHRSDTVVSTPHFRVHRNGDRPRIDHGIRPERLDNELAGVLAEELFAPGWLSGSDVFERVFTGIVTTTADDPMSGWAWFYDNTLCRIRDSWAVTPTARSSIEEIVPVYRRVLDLVPSGRVLEVGSCFGFLTMLLAERPNTEVIASDIDQGTIDLLRSMLRKRGLSVGTLVCDAARIPLPHGAVDTVVMVHLLEHLEPERGMEVLSEALRLARRRVVVAVPFEAEPTVAYGHVRTFTLPMLEEMGRETGQPFEVSEHYGGWLVLRRE